MKTVRDVCELHPNALSIRHSDQIEQLDELTGEEGDGTAFFERTHITQGMQDLISEGIARLAGASSQAVFHLKQAIRGIEANLGARSHLTPDSRTLSADAKRSESPRWR